MKTFYSEVSKNCLTFFRQGHCITSEAENISNTWSEKITDSDLGSMYLLFEEALIVRSSSSILFFKINPECGEWEQYHQIKNMRGQIYFIKGNIRF